MITWSVASTASQAFAVLTAIPRSRPTSLRLRSWPLRAAGIRPGGGTDVGSLHGDVAVAPPEETLQGGGLAGLAGAREQHHWELAGGPAQDRLEAAREIDHGCVRSCILNAKIAKADWAARWTVGRLVPIEAKASATPRPAMANGIAAFQRDLGRRAAPGFVVHPGDQALPLGAGTMALPFAWL